MKFRVVVLPTPVGPVSRIRPFWMRVNSSITRRQPQFGGRADRLLAHADGHFGTAGMIVDAGAKAAYPFRVAREAKLEPLLEDLALPGQQHLVDQFAEHGFVQRLRPNRHEYRR